MSKVTWKEIIAIEPALKQLLDEAKKVKDVPPAANWCPVNLWYVSYKPRLVGLVGFQARSHNQRIRTMDAYDVAYDKVYDALPNCPVKGCCWDSD